MTTALVWFRRDLRLTDNPALHRAASECERVIPVYLHAPQEEMPWPPGAASFGAGAGTAFARIEAGAVSAGAGIDEGTALRHS